MRHRGPRLRRLATVLALGAVALPCAPGRARGGDVDAAALFAGRCATCHTVPHPTLRMDRAWLAQVRETS